MKIDNFIPLKQLCTHYKIEFSFFETLYESGLIDIKIIEQVQCIHHDNLNDVEKMIRMYRDLGLNIEGIDIVFNLLQKVTDLTGELTSVKSRLRLYENEL
jgi:hypothetical protein